MGRNWDVSVGVPLQDLKTQSQAGGAAVEQSLVRVPRSIEQSLRTEIPPFPLFRRRRYDDQAHLHNRPRPQPRFPPLQTPPDPFEQSPPQSVLCAIARLTSPFRRWNYCDDRRHNQAYPNLLAAAELQRP